MNKKINILVLIILILLIGILYFTKQGDPNNDEINNTDPNLNLKLPAGPAVNSQKNETLGEFLTDTNGMTLYTFSNDGKMKSSCTEDCLTKWPPFYYDNKNFQTSKDDLSRKMNVFKREDGKFQYAFGEQPVYYYVGDKKAGDVNGNGLNSGKWSVVKVIK